MGVIADHIRRKAKRLETVKPFLEVGLDRNNTVFNFGEYVSFMLLFAIGVRQILLAESRFSDDDIGTLKDWTLFSFLIIHSAPSYLNISLDKTRNGKIFRNFRCNVAILSHNVWQSLDDFIFFVRFPYGYREPSQKKEVLRSKTVSRVVAEAKEKYPEANFVETKVGLPPVHVNSETYDGLFGSLLAFIHPGLGEKLSRTYVRVGSTFSHRLDHACRMNVVKDLTPQQRANWDIGFKRLHIRLRESPGYWRMGERISARVKSQKFEDIKYDPKAAAGYPYPAGVKKKHVIEKACRTARGFMASVNGLKEFLKDSVWYTAGRAKLMERNKIPNARVVSYCPFAINLVEMLYYSDFQAWAMTKACPWCAVGFSWFYGGATDFAKHMKAEKGLAPEGYKYVTLDVKDWDSSIRAYTLHGLCAVHCNIMRDFGVGEIFIQIFSLCFVSMINAVLAFPGFIGLLFHSGFKSGGTATSFNGSLMHESAFLYICDYYSMDENAPHKVHSDDNIWLVPIHVTKEMILQGYANLGFVVKVYFESVELGKVDFLSKFCTYAGNGEYVPKRIPESDTILRLLLPESDRGVNGQDDAWATYCRLYGHMLDAAFSKEVYQSITEMMRILQVNYGISTGPTPSDFENHFILEGIFSDERIVDEFGRLPLVPPREEVLRLYGVQEVSWMADDVPQLPWVKSLSPTNIFRSKDLVTFRTACNFRDGLFPEELMHNYNRAAFRRINFFTSPFPSTHMVTNDALGFHASRLNGVFKHFDLVNPEVLSSIYFLAPCNGCEAQMAIRWGWYLGLKDFSVSTIDTANSYGQLPYPVIGGLYRPFHKHQRVEQEHFFNVRHVAYGASCVVITPESHVFDASWDDRRRSYWILTYISKLYLRGVQNVIVSFAYCDEGMLERFYRLFQEFGSVELFNPVFSNPWKGCYYVVIQRKKSPPMPRQVFQQRCRGFLNRIGEAMIPWIGQICKNISRDNAQQPLIRCPHQYDEDYIDYLRSQMFLLTPIPQRWDGDDGIASLCDGPGGLWPEVRNMNTKSNSLMGTDSSNLHDL